MKRFYILTFIIIMAFCVPGASYGEVVIADHQRVVSVWAPPNMDDVQYFLLDNWDGHAEEFGDGDNHARAVQKSNIDYSYGTKLIVNGVGSTYIQGASEAYTYIRIDFVVRDEDEYFKVNYDLTGDATIQLYNDWTWTNIIHSFTGKDKQGNLKLVPGTYRLWVASYWEASNNIGSFNMCFTIPSTDDVCESSAVTALPFILLPLFFSE